MRTGEKMDKDFCIVLLGLLTNLLKQLNIMELYRLGAISKENYLKLQVNIKKGLDSIKFE